MTTTLKLQQQAYIDGTNDNAYYTAGAVIAGQDAEHIDTEHYDIQWAINCPEAEDESDACDWSKFYVYTNGKLVGNQDNFTLIECD